jgi:hypothetical protein
LEAKLLGMFALSITMTNLSTLATRVMEPALFEFSSQAAGISGDLKIPAINVAQVLQVP